MDIKEYELKELGLPEKRTADFSLGAENVPPAKVVCAGRAQDVSDCSSDSPGLGGSATASSIKVIEAVGNAQRPCVSVPGRDARKFI